MYNSHAHTQSLLRRRQKGRAWNGQQLRRHDVAVPKRVRLVVQLLAQQVDCDLLARGLAVGVGPAAFREALDAVDAAILGQLGFK